MEDRTRAGGVDADAAGGANEELVGTRGREIGDDASVGEDEGSLVAVGIA